MIYDVINGSYWSGHHTVSSLISCNWTRCSASFSPPPPYRPSVRGDTLSHKPSTNIMTFRRIFFDIHPIKARSMNEAVTHLTGKILGVAQQWRHRSPTSLVESWRIIGLLDIGQWNHSFTSNFLNSVNEFWFDRRLKPTILSGDWILTEKSRSVTRGKRRRAKKKTSLKASGNKGHAQFEKYEVQPP